MRVLIVTVDACCWGIFGFVWLAGWLYNLRNAPKAAQTGGGFLLGGWSSWVLVALAVWILNRLAPGMVWSQITYWNLTLALVGLAVLVSSTLFTLWARWVLGTMWTSAPKIKERHELRTDGPYRITRHPIYTGILGMIVGTTLVDGFGVMLVVLVASVVYLVFKSRAEERLLTDRFGDRYLQYRRRVPALLPGLRRF